MLYIHQCNRIKCQYKGIGDLPLFPYKWEDIQHGRTINIYHYSNINNWGVFKRSRVQMNIEFKKMDKDEFNKLAKELRQLSKKATTK